MKYFNTTLLRNTTNHSINPTWAIYFIRHLTTYNNMQSGGNNKRKSPHHRADKPFHDDLLQRNKKERSSTATLAASNATAIKPCRFLTCAVKMANKNALVVLVSNKEDAHGLPPPLPQDSDERGSELSSNNKNKKKKEKEKKEKQATRNHSLPVIFPKSIQRLVAVIGSSFLPRMQLLALVVTRSTNRSRYM
jgi:hypothetical protein